MSQITKEEIINQLDVFLKEYLQGELQGEGRKPLDKIECTVDNEYQFTECCALTNSTPDELADDYQGDVKPKYASDVVDWGGGYSVPKNVVIPVTVSWTIYKTHGVTSICVKSYWEDIEIEQGESND